MSHLSTSTLQTSGEAPPPLIDAPEHRKELERLELIATWLDRRFLDPLLGFFFPGAGDTLCSLVGLYGVFVAIRIGVHPIVVARMLLNLGIDALFGGVPFLGAIFDVFYRAHVRNLELIHARAAQGRPSVGDWVLVGGAFLLFLVALLLPLVLVGFIAAFLIERLTS